MSTAETAEARPTSLAKTGASLEPDRSARTRALSLVAQQFFADWRREWTVVRPGATTKPRLGTLGGALQRRGTSDGENPKDPDDDGNADHTYT